VNGRARRIITLLSAPVAAVLAVGLAAVGPAASPAAGAPAVSSWPQFGRTPAHPNDAPAETAFTQRTVGSLAEAWRANFGTNASSFGGAAVVGGIAYIAGSDGVLSAFSTAACAAGSCKPLWTGKTDGIFGTPAVAGGRVFVGSNDHFLYAFRAGGCGAPTCAPLFRGQVTDAILGGVSVTGGVAYVGDFGGTVYAFPAAGCGRAVCAPSWTAPSGPDETITTTPAVGGGHVFVSTFFNTPDDFSGRLHSYAAGGCGRKTCKPEWTADLLGPTDNGLSPLVSGGTVFAGSSTRFAETPNGPLHLFAFAVDGCGRKTCKPLRSYRTGDSDLTGGIALSGGILYASSQSTPDPFNTVGVVTAFPASGCGGKPQEVCDPLWTGINFASGSESPPVVTGDVVFVAKGPASGFPVDEAVLSYPARGCGAEICLPLSFTSLGDEQFYLGQPLAVADHTLFAVTGVTATGADDLVALRVDVS
jgi:outer membrane protein assembly factor BamB